MNMEERCCNSPRNHATGRAAILSDDTSTGTPDNGTTTTDRGKVVKWTSEVQRVFLAACMEVLDDRTRKDLERRVRSGTGTECNFNSKCCTPVKTCAAHCGTDGRSFAVNRSGGSDSGGGAINGGCADTTATMADSSADGTNQNITSCQHCNPMPYMSCKGESDILGKHLDDWMSCGRLASILGAISERASKVYVGVVSKARKDGIQIGRGSDEDIHLHKEILREAIVRELQSRLAHVLRQDSILDSQEGGLFANPGNYKDGPLCFLLPDTIRDLMVNGVAVQSGFVGEQLREAILRELELMDFDGRFSEVYQQSMLNVRKDFMCWVTKSDLDRQRQQGLRRLLDCLFALPFELNKKANLCLQIGWITQMAVFPANNAYYRCHVDGGFTNATNNGKKITVIYYPNPRDWTDADGGVLNVYRRRNREMQTSGAVVLPSSDEDPMQRILPSGDTLVLLRSREMPHEVSETHRKRFAISFWITGPPGPGDAV